MASEIDLWVVIPLCILGFAVWVGVYIYMTLTVIKNDPREIKYRKSLGKDLGLFPEKLFNQQKDKIDNVRK